MIQVTINKSGFESAVETSCCVVVDVVFRCQPLYIDVCALFYVLYRFDF